MIKEAPEMIHLQQIPEKLIAKILSKIPLKNGVKMRRTCQFVDSLVEENSVIFAPEQDFQLTLEISNLMTEDLIVRLEIRNPHLVNGLNYLSRNLTVVDESLGCILFTCIILATAERWHYPNRTPNPQISDDVMDFLKDLHLKSKCLKTIGISYSQLSVITPHYTYAKFKNLTPQPFDKVLEAVSHNCRRIGTRVEVIPLQMNLKELRHMEKVELYGVYMKNQDDTKQFALFLKDARCISAGFLKSLKFSSFCYEAKFRRQIEFWPGCRFVWKGPTRSGPNPSDRRLYVMDTPHQTVIVSVWFLNLGSDEQRRCLRFTRKDDCEEILLAISKDFFQRKPVDMSHILRELQKSLPDQYPSVLRKFLQNIMIFDEFIWFYHMFGR